MEVHHAFSLQRALVGGTFALLLGDPFRDAQTARLIEMAEAVAQRQGMSKGMQARLAFVLVEAFQNIIRHRPRADADGGDSGFILRTVPGGQQVITRNPVADADLPALHGALDKVIGKSPELLKTLFLSVLQANASTAKGGAGLGLIEMARRSGHDPAYALEPLGPGRHSFTLQAVLGEAVPWSMGAAAEAFKVQRDLGVVAALHGDPSPAQFSALVALVHDQEPEHAPLHHCLLAATQLVEDTMGERSGPVLVAVRRKAGGGWCVGMGAAFAAPKAQRLVETVGALGQESAINRQRRYRAALEGRDPAGAGLVELAVRSVSGLVAATRPLEDDLAFVWLEARC